MVRITGASLLLALSAARHIVCLEEVDVQNYVAGGWAQQALQVQSVGDCHQACRELLSLSTESNSLLTHYPDLPADFAKKFYVGQEAEKLPICSVEPQSANAVSLVVKAVREHQCPFAVKSGGHGRASNVHGGLLLDLSRLNETVLSDDGTSAFVGPGGRWGDVFKTLQPHGRAVLGGRIPTVGVGGFLMGGGVSFLSPQRGWAFDNIRSYEVVLPNGTIANASTSSHPDIYFALRGGGSSFGIVTRFELDTFPDPGLWGSMHLNIANDIAEREAKLGVRDSFRWTFTSAAIIVSSWVQRFLFWLPIGGVGVSTSEVTKTLFKLNEATDLDLVPQAYLFLTWVPYVKAYLTGTAYASPSSQAKESPAALESLRALPAVLDTHREQTMLELTQEQEGYQSPWQVRQSWWTLTFKLDAELMKEIWDIFILETATLKHDVPDLMMSNNVQFILRDQITGGTRNGGNAFGLEVKDGPFFMFSITADYFNAKDDERVRQGCLNILSKAKELGKKTGLYHPFLYPNYANREQDVYAGFAPSNLRRLAAIQERYDPGRVFAKLQPNHLAFGNRP